MFRVLKRSIYYTDENTSGSGQKLYYHNFGPFLSAGLTDVNVVNFTAFPNPFIETITVQLHLMHQESYELVVFDGDGQLLYKKAIEPGAKDMILKSTTVLSSMAPKAIILLGCNKAINWFFSKGWLSNFKPRPFFHKISGHLL